MYPAAMDDSSIGQLEEFEDVDLDDLNWLLEHARL